MKTDPIANAPSSARRVRFGPVWKHAKRESAQPEQGGLTRTANWLLSHHAAILAMVGITAYLLGYWFFDGYLGGYGYSMRSMPHDYAAVMMEAFLLVLNLGTLTMNQQQGVLLFAATASATGVAILALIYWSLRSGVKGLARIGTRIDSERERRQHVASTDGRRNYDHAQMGFVRRVLAGSALTLLAVAASVGAWIAFSGTLVLVVVGVHWYGTHLATKEIRQFVPCEKRGDGKRCLVLNAGAVAYVGGDVVAGTDDLLLIFDGSSSHLLKRNDDLRGVVLVKSVTQGPPAPQTQAVPASGAKP